MTRRAAIIWVWGLVLIAGAVGGGFVWWRQQDVAQAYEAARAAADADRWEEALTLAQPYAERDDPRINGLLADAYINGPDSIQDIDKGLTLRRLAAEAGDMRAAYFLGRWILENEPTEAQTQEAIGYLHEAADCGMPMANYELGIFYVEGFYVDKDLQKAVEHTESAAFAGVQNAYWNSYVIRSRIAKSEGDLHGESAKIGSNWLMIAAINGNAEAKNIETEIRDYMISYDNENGAAAFNDLKKKAIQRAERISPLDSFRCSSTFQ